MDPEAEQNRDNDLLLLPEVARLTRLSESTVHWLRQPPELYVGSYAPAARGDVARRGPAAGRERGRARRRAGWPRLLRPAYSVGTAVLGPSIPPLGKACIRVVGRRAHSGGHQGRRGRRAGQGARHLPRYLAWICVPSAKARCRPELKAESPAKAG